MNNQDFTELGNQIQDIIQQAVDSKDFQELNQTIREALNTAVDNGSEALKKALEGYGKQKTYHQDAKKVAKEWRDQRDAGVEKVRGTVEKKQNTDLMLYADNSREKTAGVLMTVSGGILTGSMCIGFLVTSIIQAAASGVWGISALLGAGMGVMGLGMIAGAGLLYAGIRRLGAHSRFKKYLKALGNKTYVDFSALSKISGKSVRLVKKDVKKMIDKGWFRQGHVDQAETCLITSDETFQQYKESQEQMEARNRQREEESRQMAEKARKVSALDSKVRDILERGETYLEQIRKCNEAIPGEIMTEKISRIEVLVNRIFERVKEHPEVVSDLRKMMDYYLPMTVKLLDAYADMDSQPIQGENIRTAKQEIEDSLDTLNIAFEKLLDSIFQDTAWDVSSDISVLQTLLAQDGLTQEGFGQN